MSSNYDRKQINAFGQFDKQKKKISISPLEGADIDFTFSTKRACLVQKLFEMFLVF